MVRRKEKPTKGSKASVAGRMSTRNASNARNSMYGLGDESVSSDSDVEDSRQPNATTRNETDYGLEFTNTSIDMSTPARSSTLRERAPLRPLNNNSNRNRNKSQESPPLTSLQALMSRSREMSQQNQAGASQAAAEKSQRKKYPTAAQRQRRYIKEIIKLRNRTDFLIPRQPFGRVVREITQSIADDTLRFTVGALEALQVACESYLTQRMEDSYLLTLHRGRVTLELRDMKLVAYLRLGSSP